MSGDGPKSTSQPFFTDLRKGGMTSRPDSESLADYTGPNDPDVMRKRLGEFLEQHGDRAIERMEENVRASAGLSLSANEWLWLEKQRAHLRWHTKQLRREELALSRPLPEPAVDEDDDEESEAFPPQEIEQAHAGPKPCEIKWGHADNNLPIGRVRRKMHRWRNGVHQAEFDWTRWFEICADHATQLPSREDREDWEFELRAEGDMTEV
jgi:hypothetical protein